MKHSELTEDILDVSEIPDKMLIVWIENDCQLLFPIGYEPVTSKMMMAVEAIVNSITQHNPVCDPNCMSCKFSQILAEKISKTILSFSKNNPELAMMEAKGQTKQ